MSGSPTQRTLKKWRDAGYMAAVVERWNPHAKIRQDLFGIIDVIAVGNGETVGVQSTSDSNLSARVKKLGENAETVEALKGAGWRVVAEGWKKKGNRWQSREIEI